MEDILSISTLSMSEKAVTNTESIDRLSSLPEHLISDILSKLPTMDSAVATSILSRHWRYQWTHVTCFNMTALHLSDFHDLHTFLTTVDNILQKLASLPNLRTFFLCFRFQYSDVDLIENVNAYDFCRTFLLALFHRLCSSHTEQLLLYEYGGCLHVLIENAPLFSICSRKIESSAVVDTQSLPECIFQNETLVQLRLDTKTFSFKLPHYLILPNLRQLSLCIYDFDRQLMRTIFKSLPLVEDLTVSVFFYDDDHHFIDISAPNLKIFTINFEGEDSQTNVLIDAPKLEQISILNWYGLVLIRFVKNPIHLLRTSLTYSSSVGDDFEDDIAILELLKAIKCTRRLEICCRILNILNSYNVDELPAFHNLVSLSLRLDVENTDFAMPAWILRRVKTIKVEGFVKEYDKLLSLMENILSKANVLEWLICMTFPDAEETKKMDTLQKENDFVKALFMLPRVSSCCEIDFYGRSGHSSTDGVKTRLFFWL